MRAKCCGEMSYDIDAKPGNAYLESCLVFLIVGLLITLSMASKCV